MLLLTVYGAYSMRESTLSRDWNTREIACGILVPSRETQLVWLMSIFLYISPLHYFSSYIVPLKEKKMFLMCLELARIPYSIY